MNFKILKELTYLPEGNILMVGNTINSLERNVLDPIQKIVGKKNCVLKRQNKEVFILGRKIWIEGADKEDAYKRIEGESLLRAYVDEWTRIPKNFTKTMMSRLSDRGSAAYGTCNPGPPSHYLYKDYISKAASLNIRVWKFTLDDNPWLDAEYKRDIIAENPPGTVFYDRNILGNWVAASGLVFGNFDALNHTVPCPPVQYRAKELRVGVDYGTHNPAAFIALEKYLIPGRAKPTWYATREYYWDSQIMLQQKTDAEYSKDLAAWLSGVYSAPPRLKAPGSMNTEGRFVSECGSLNAPQMEARKVYPQTIEVDPSASSFILQCNRDGMHKATAAENDILNGIRKIANMLAAGDLIICQTCPWLIWSMANYAWDVDKGEDEVIKEDDHPVDALRYVVNSL